MRKICLRCGAKFGSRAEYCPHDGTLLASDDDFHLPDPLVGTLLLEQFRVEEQIGVGGMGTVYRAHQTTVGRDVAIKVLRAELARDDQAVLRFEREARLCTALDHPNLVRVFLSGRLPDGRLYIVMELLQGRSLADEIDTEGPLPLDRAVLVLLKLCAGLAAVHGAGIVHRDIKPENVYLVKRQRDSDFVKLVDFGVARVLEQDGFGPTTTQSGRVFGTATYISPEAATGEDTDFRSDIYSLGVLAYQLFTGELPFEGSTAGAVLMKHVHEDPPPFSSKGRGAEVPAGLESVVMKALRKDPDERPQTLARFVGALAEAAGNAGLLVGARGVLLGTVWGDELAAPGSYLAELLAGSSPSSLPPALDDTQRSPIHRDADDDAFLSSAPKPFGTTAHDLAPMPKRRKKRRGWLWAALGLLGVLLIGIVASAWLNPRGSSTTAPVDAPPETLTEETVADVGTDDPVDVDVVEPPSEPEPAPEPVAVGADAPDDPPPIAEDERSPEPRDAKPRASKRKRKPKKTPPTGEPSPVPTDDGASAPTTAEPAPSTRDDGIDWSVPDFPEESLEPPPPTGTPETSPRNPVVIDEPPRGQAPPSQTP